MNKAKAVFLGAPLSFLSFKEDKENPGWRTSFLPAVRTAVLMNFVFLAIVSVSFLV
ncbi:MAG: hypothetical protein ACLFVG_02485 [Candidatus Aminicenantes bacterium]